MNNCEYKSPIAALIWSLLLPGFGQVYNGEIFLGIIFMLWELGANTLSNLNISIMASFHGDFQKAHDTVNFQWGLFYPSILGFSMWQAYNKAKTINAQIDGKINKKIHLTGFLSGLVIGTNLGIYWHFPLATNDNYFSFLESPVFFGLILGLILGFIGHWIEKGFLKKLHSSINGKR